MRRLTLQPIAHPHHQVGTTTTVGEAFSQLCRESQQWDLPECDRTSPPVQR